MAKEPLDLESLPEGLSYPQYLEVMAEQAAAPVTDLNPEAVEKIEFTRLNEHRSARIGRTWRPSPELAREVKAIASPQVWLVLTEPWCGDSAQCLPCLATLAQGNPLLQMRLFLRDANLDLMDRFLTDGKRSIPILSVRASQGSEIFRWGPRPAAAQEVFAAAQAEGLAKPEILERLHLFYGRNRGRALDGELLALLAAASGLASTGGAP